MQDAITRWPALTYATVFGLVLLAGCSQSSSASGNAASGGAGGSGATSEIGGTTTTSGGAPTAQTTVLAPCDIYAAGNTPCVAAHSMVRARYGAYNGNLYQVRRITDQATKDIGVLAPGGFADSNRRAGASH